MAVATGDPVVTLLALDAHSRDLVGFDLPGELTVEIGLESFGSERWLLLYEAVRHGWLAEPEVLESDPFTPFFAMLHKADVIFYDSEVELAKIDRPFDQLHGINMPVLGFVFGIESLAASNGMPPPVRGTGHRWTRGISMHHRLVP